MWPIKITVIFTSRNWFWILWTTFLINSNVYTKRSIIVSTGGRLLFTVRRVEDRTWGCVWEITTSITSNSMSVSPWPPSSNHGCIASWIGQTGFHGYKDGIGYTYKKRVLRQRKQERMRLAVFMEISWENLFDLSFDKIISHRVQPEQSS